MDVTDFKQQFLPCHRKLFRVAFQLMGNAQDAEDMVQEAYLKLWNKRGQLNGVLNAEAYSVTLINISADFNIISEMEWRDEVNQVQRLISQLPRQQKHVMILRDVNDCSFEEIEQATGLNAVNIRVLLSRARKKIREQFNAIVEYETR